MVSATLTLGADNKNLLPFSKFCNGDMDWIDLAQDRDRWQALVNAVMDLRVL
jgi:hypothetical protein